VTYDHYPSYKGKHRRRISVQDSQSIKQDTISKKKKKSSTKGAARVSEEVEHLLLKKCKAVSLTSDTTNKTNKQTTIKGSQLALNGS
jgi:hypothetical protein